MAPQWDEVSFVLASTYRVTVLEYLVNRPATPSQLAEDTELSMSHISRALGELREQTLVELLVSDDRKKGRVYGITEQGTDIWETIEAENLA
ncbi:ArsR family transcriptional regulator [Halocatena salina]|uniref:ArsR family transcriptional regulator n=1 Tax=Halocatena salina TaxID=2934340 RepID=A0A8U0A0L7_9EURY|nr:ArsR family transcriptional regulator [Halocatena salina]UPM42691.1 ArsR family transcriptional regulator [Halocatena salina]